MPDDQHIQERMIPSETFVKQVKQALENLYDFVYLEHHPLAQEAKGTAGRPGETAGQSLRRALMAAIESLNPGMDVPFRAPQARLYNLLHLHYVEGSTVQATARELSISLRQTYRVLKHGEENVASLLWAHLSPPLTRESSVLEISSIQSEMSRLETHSLPTDVRSLLQHAQGAVKRLAQQQTVSLCIKVPPEPVIVHVDSAIAQQVLVNILSHAVQESRSGTLFLTLTEGKQHASLRLRYEPRPNTRE